MAVLAPEGVIKVGWDCGTEPAKHGLTTVSSEARPQDVAQRTVTVLSRTLGLSEARHGDDRRADRMLPVRSLTARRGAATT
jgi:hypothetical protein